jgi:tetratricopeptide (TPR) repeat protein
MSLSVDRALRKAKSLARNGEVDLAIQVLNDVLDRYPKNGQAINGLKALHQLKAADGSAITGPSRQQLIELTALYKEGRLQEALAQGEALAKQFPNEAIIANLLGAIYGGLGRPEQAASSYKRALQIKPDFAEAHNNLGDALRILGNSEEAVASYKTALQINPGFVIAHNNLGEALVDLGKPEEAIPRFELALQLQPDFAEAHINLAETLNELGMPDEAITSCDKALQINPAFAKAHRFLSTVKTFQDDDPQIHQMLQLLERKKLPENEQMHLNLALAKAHEDIGDYDNAFSYFVEGNRLRHKELNYRISSTRTFFAKIKTAFSNEPPVLQSPEESASDNYQ